MAATVAAWLVAVTWALAASGAAAREAGTGQDAKRPNLLVVIFDDLRPAVGGFSNPGTASIVTPSLDKLLARSGTTVFDRAFVQQAVCGPSRTSFLTGRRPDSTKLYDFASYWRKAAGNWSTWPQLLREAGYATHSIGKVFHPLKAMEEAGHVDDYPFSWSVPGWHPPTQQYKMSAVCPPVAGVQPPSSVLNKTYTNVLCPVVPADMPGGSLPDLQSADYAVELLSNLSKTSSPWMVAVGFHKPHIPFKFPKEFLDAHPIEEIEAPPDAALPDLLPHVAYDPWTDVRSRDDVTALIEQQNISFPFGPLPTPFAKMLRQHYYASVTYVDAQLGRLLDALWSSSAADDTIVALWGDHGWQLGERDDWAKYATCDTATRIPLVVNMPPSLHRRGGRPSAHSLAVPSGHYTSSALVEAVDIGPTLLDLCGVTVPPLCPAVGQPDACVEGSSFASIVRSGNGAYWHKATAWSQYSRPSDEPEQNSDMPVCADITVMGYSMRRADLRFTEWVGFRCRTDKVTGRIASEADWNDIHATELYIHNGTTGDDVYETANVAGSPAHRALVAELRAQLRAGWRHDPSVLVP